MSGGEPVVMCGSGELLMMSAEWARVNDGCGKTMPITEAFRCLDCRRWYHADCMAFAHFGRELLTDR